MRELETAIEETVLVPQGTGLEALSFANQAEAEDRIVSSEIVTANTKEVAAGVEDEVATDKNGKTAVCTASADYYNLNSGVELRNPQANRTPFAATDEWRPQYQHTPYKDQAFDAVYSQIQQLQMVSVNFVVIVKCVYVQAVEKLTPDKQRTQYAVLDALKALRDQEARFA